MCLNSGSVIYFETTASPPEDPGLFLCDMVLITPSAHKPFVETKSDPQEITSSYQLQLRIQGSCRDCRKETQSFLRCETDDKVPVQELASCCHKWAMSQGRSSFYRRCQVQGQSFGVERGTESPIKRAPRGFSSTQNAPGLSFTLQHLCPILVTHSFNK